MTESFSAEQYGALKRAFEQEMIYNQSKKVCYSATQLVNVNQDPVFFNLLDALRVGDGAIDKTSGDMLKSKKLLVDATVRTVGIEADYPVTFKMLLFSYNGDVVNLSNDFWVDAGKPIAPLRHLTTKAIPNVNILADPKPLSLDSRDVTMARLTFDIPKEFLPDVSVNTTTTDDKVTFVNNSLWIMYVSSVTSASIRVTTTSSYEFTN